MAIGRQSDRLLVDGQSLDSTWERFNNSTEIQDLRSNVSTISSNLEDLNDLVTTLELGGLWELIDPIVGSWNISTDTGAWQPSILVVNDEYQFRDGEKTQERLVETYERHKETGGERLVDSYAQTETEYFYNARYIEAAASSDGSVPGDARGWSYWEDVGAPHNCNAWLPRQRDWPRNTLMQQSRLCQQDSTREKYVWEVNRETGEETLLDHLTNWNDGKTIGSSGNDYTNLAASISSCGGYVCWGNPFTKDGDLHQTRTHAKGTGRTLRNGCYYSETEEVHHKTYSYTSFYGSAGYITKNVGGPRYMVRTYKSNNAYTSANSVLEVYVEGWPILSGYRSCSFGGCTNQTPAKDGWVDRPYDATKSPFKAARIKTNKGGLVVSEMPIYLPAIRKKITIGSKVAETVVTRTSWYDGGTWQEYDRKFKVCISNY